MVTVYDCLHDGLLQPGCIEEIYDRQIPIDRVVSRVNVVDNPLSEEQRWIVTMTINACRSFDNQEEDKASSVKKVYDQVFFTSLDRRTLVHLQALLSTAERVVYRADEGSDVCWICWNDREFRLETLIIDYWNEQYMAPLTEVYAILSQPASVSIQRFIKCHCSLEGNLVVDQDYREAFLEKIQRESIRLEDGQ